MLYRSFFSLLQDLEALHPVHVKPAGRLDVPAGEVPHCRRIIKAEGPDGAGIEAVLRDMDAIQPILGIIGKVYCVILEGRQIRDASLACTRWFQFPEGLLTGGTEREEVFLTIDFVDREGLLRDEQDVEVFLWPFVLVAPVMPLKLPIAKVRGFLGTIASLALERYKH